MKPALTLLANTSESSCITMNLFDFIFLTTKQTHGYDNKTTAKNSGQNLPSGFKKMRGRILHKYGFFYARKIFRVMTGCIEELSSSPRSFLSGKANSVQSVTLQFALKMTAINLKRDKIRNW